MKIEKYLKELIEVEQKLRTFPEVIEIKSEEEYKKYKKLATQKEKLYERKWMLERKIITETQGMGENITFKIGEYNVQVNPLKEKIIIKRRENYETSGSY